MLFLRNVAQIHSYPRTLNYVVKSESKHRLQHTAVTVVKLYVIVTRNVAMVYMFRLTSECKRSEFAEYSRGAQS
jgi:hypothetical protein